MPTPLSFRALIATAMMLIAVVAVGLEGASLPHVHDGAGLYNHEHDLGYLATIGGIGPVPGSPAAPVLAPVVAAVLVPVLPAPLLALYRHADPRAPPLV